MGDSTLDTIVFRVRTAADPGELEQLISAYEISSVVVTCDVASSQQPEPAASGRESAPGPREPVPAAEPEPTAPEAKQTPQSSPATSPTGGADGVAAKPSAARKAAPARGKPAGAAGKGENGAARTGETLRVDQERLDYLMNLGGELVINRARFVQIHGTFREVLDGRNLGYLVDDMSHHITQLASSVDEWQKTEGAGTVEPNAQKQLLHIVRRLCRCRSVRCTAESAPDTRHQKERRNQ